MTSLSIQLSFNPIHLAYGVMIIGIIFCFVASRNLNKDMRKAVDEFALPFVRLSNYISPTPPAGGLLVEELGNGRVRALPVEEQPEGMRVIIKRANADKSVKLFEELVTAADEVGRQAGINRTKKTQFAQPIDGLLQMTHTFLAGCEDLSTIDTVEKKKQFDSYLLEQVDHRMTLLCRIRGITGDEYRKYNKVYAAEMEAREKAEEEARRGRKVDKNKDEQNEIK